MINWKQAKWDIHQNAIAHGWWDGDRPMEDVVALIHSEWSEALEAYRNGEQLVWKKDDGKPEGVGVELIDGVIRVLDAAEAWKVPLFENPDSMNVLKEQVRKQGYADCTLPKLVCKLHLQTCHMLTITLDTVRQHCMEVIVALVWTWIDMQGDDPESILIEKHKFNLTRPFRHGGKVI